MKKSLLVSLAAVMIFGLMGFGFAMWADTVSVSATVDTGNVEIGIRDVGTNDNLTTTAILGGTATNNEDGFADAMPLGGDPQIDPGLNSEGKNVATYTSSNGDGSSGTPTPKFEIDGVGGFYSSITETITNAYPYYAPSTKIQIASNGSIPVKIDGFRVTPSGELTDCNMGDWTITKPDNSTVTGNGLDALLAALDGIQLHQGQVVTIEVQVWFGQDLVQGSYGSITYDVHACQWNEYGQPIPADQGIWPL